MKTAMTIAWGCIPSAYVVAESIQSCLGKPTHLGIAHETIFVPIGGDIVAKSGTDPVYDSRKTVKVVEIEEKFRPDGTEKDGLSDATSDKLKR